MVKISEIVHRTSKSDLLDTMADTHDIVPLVYKLYDDILTITDNYKILPHDMDGNQQHELYDMKDLFARLKTLSENMPTTTKVYQMIDEMNNYFKWF